MQNKYSPDENPKIIGPFIVADIEDLDEVERDMLIDPEYDDEKED